MLNKGIKESRHISITTNLPSQSVSGGPSFATCRQLAGTGLLAVPKGFISVCMAAAPCLLYSHKPAGSISVSRLRRFFSTAMSPGV